VNTYSKFRGPRPVRLGDNHQYPTPFKIWTVSIAPRDSWRTKLKSCTVPCSIRCRKIHGTVHHAGSKLALVARFNLTKFTQMSSGASYLIIWLWRPNLYAHPVWITGLGGRFRIRAIKQKRYWVSYQEKIIYIFHLSFTEFDLSCCSTWAWRVRNYGAGCFNPILLDKAT
jgi:hypothetical protein